MIIPKVVTSNSITGMAIHWYAYSVRQLAEGHDG